MQACIAAVGMAIARPMGALNPPAAFSIRADDLDYHPDWRRIGPRFDVLVDGHRVHRVVAYNCAAGWVRRLKANDEGKLELVMVGNTMTVLEETLQGDVTVAWRTED